MGTLEHQDWNQIILRNPNANKESQKQKNTPHVEISQTQKLASTDDPSKPKVVSRELAQQIISARTAKKWTRKDLATRINEQEGLVARYETCKEIPKVNVLQKMRKVLCCKLISN